MKITIISIVLISMIALSSQQKLFFQTDNSDWYNWLQFVFGFVQGVYQEIAFIQREDCYSGTLGLGNGIIGLSVFADSKFIDFWDWSTYILTLIQIFIDMYQAFRQCGYYIYSSPLHYVAGSLLYLGYDTITVERSWMMLDDSVKAFNLFIHAMQIFTSFWGGYYYFFTWNVTSFTLGTTLLILNLLDISL